MSDQDTSAAAAIVECLIKRPAPNFTIVEFNNPESGDPISYQFTPDTLGRHVAVIANQDHVSRLAAIPEGYRIVGVAAAPAPVPQQAPVQLGVSAAEAVSLMSPEDAAKIVQGSQDTAPEARSMTSDEAADLQALQEAAERGDEGAMTRLRKLYTSVVGRPWSPKAKPMTLAATIEAVRAEAAAAQ